MLQIFLGHYDANFLNIPFYIVALVKFRLVKTMAFSGYIIVLNLH